MKRAWPWVGLSRVARRVDGGLPDGSFGARPCSDDQFFGAALGHCRALRLGRPDGDFQLADRQRFAVIALGVGAEEPDVEVFLVIEESRVGDLQRARAVPRQVVDHQRIAPARPGGG